MGIVTRGADSEFDPKPRGAVISAVALRGRLVANYARVVVVAPLVHEHPARMKHLHA